MLKRDFLDVTPNDVYFLKCQQDIIYSKQTMWAPERFFLLLDGFVED
jgi:hypothetical protein